MVNLLALLVVVGATGNGTNSFLLLDWQGDCPKGSRVVIADTPERHTYSTGCWARRDDTVYIVPKLGEPFTMPAKVFTWAEGV